MANRGRERGASPVEEFFAPLHRFESLKDSEGDESAWRSNAVLIENTTLALKMRIKQRRLTMQQGKES